MRSLAVLSLVLASVAVPPAKGEEPRNPCAAETFYHAPMSREEIFAEYAASVFRLEVRPTGDATERPIVGTAYLIDANRGYVLTAYHVVSDADNKPKSMIEGQSAALPGKKLLLKILDRREGPDIALLQITNRSLIQEAQLRPFEIALHFLPEGTQYATIGYPRGKETPNKQSAEWQGKHEGDNLLDIKQDVDEGTSGSPLIDQNGVVVATCVKEIGINEGLYSPLVDVDDMLANIPPDARSDNLDKKIRNQSARVETRQTLIQNLKWISTNIMNLEFYSWAGQAAKHRQDYEQFRTYFECPVIEALSDRRLGDSRSVQIMASIGSPNLQASLKLDSAMQNLLLGRTSTAKGDALEAQQSFRQLGDAHSQAVALTASAQADLWQRNFQEATQQLQKSIQLDPADATTKIFLAQAYAGAGDLTSAANTVQDAVTSLAGSNDRGGEAFAYRTAGEIAARQGQYEVASKHLSRSKDLFQQAGLVNGAASAQLELAEVNRHMDTAKPESHFPLTGWIGGLAIATVGFGILLHPTVRNNAVDAMRAAWQKVSHR